MPRVLARSPLASYLALLVSALLLGACASPAAPPAAPAAPPPAASQAPAPATGSAPSTVGPLVPAVTVKAASVGTSLSDAGFIIAEEKGYFRYEGIDVEHQRLGTATDILPFLGTGDLDVGGTSITAALFNGAARGIHVRAVADKGSHPKDGGYIWLAIRKDLVDSGAFSRPADIRGKSIAVSAIGSTMDLYLERWLAPLGMTLADVELVGTGFPDMPAALGTKRVDAAFMIEPALTQAEDQGLVVRHVGVGQIYPDYDGAILMYSPRFGEERRDVANRFMVAYLRGVRDYNDAFHKNKGRDEVVAILTTRTPVKDPALYGKMSLVGLNPNGYVDAPSIVDTQDWYHQRGAIPTKVDVAREIIDNRYVEAALQRLGRYQ
jgi:NitT/TauT family transport system substrate-binding protein